MLPTLPRPRSSSFRTTLSRLRGLLVLGAWVLCSPGTSLATSVTSAANIPYSGISPGGVNMATGEYCVQYRESDLWINGPMPLSFRRYYASMLAREGFASGHLGPNWLGSYDWSLSVSGPIVNVVTNRGQRIQFQQSSPVGYSLLTPTHQKYRLDLVGDTWRFTHPGLRRVFLFGGTSHLLTQILDEHGNNLTLSYTGGRLSQVSDGLGRALLFGYDATGLLTMVGDGTRSVSYAYTGGVLTGMIDAGGHTWNFVYAQPGPVQGLLVGITEPLGNTPLTQTYDPLGRVVSQTDALGGTAIYSYDAPTGSVFADPLGNMWTYLHDVQNRLMTLTDPQAGATSYSYDALGRPSTVTRPLGDMTSVAYDATSGYVSTLTLADASVYRWGYGMHSVGGATLFDLATADYPDGTMESYGRDASGNLTDFTDRGGFHWQGTHNTRGQLLTATNPSSGVTTFTYDPLGRPATGMDHAGNTTSFTFDALSRLTQITWPDATHQSYAYDALDHLTSFTDERGKLWSYAYNANGRLTTVTDPLLEASGFVYDAMDRVTQEVDPLGHARSYAYDPAGRLQSLTDRTGRITIYAHDSWGNVTGITDPASGTYSFSYDANRRMTSGQDPLGHVVFIGHDMLDRVTQLTDPVGSVFDYIYDSMGRLTSKNAPLGHTESFGYDARGLLTSFFDVTSEIDLARTPLGAVSQLTDPNRNVWPASYDPQGRLTSVADPLGRTTSYSYDSRSRMTQAEFPLGSVNLGFDAASRLGTKTFSDGTSMSYAYDDANRLTGATGASFAYDAAGRMTSSNGLVMTYDNEGRILSVTYAPGKAVSYAYDSRGLLSQVTDWMGGTTSFMYDSAHRLTGMTRPNGTSVAYAYDAADRLIQIVEARPPNPNGPPLASISITRDALGQPTSIDRRQPLMPAVTMPATTSFTYDAASQTNGFSWDPLGRLLSDGSRTFQWDGASRLTHYVAGADSPFFAYDAFGRVLSRTLGASTEQYIWNYATSTPTLAAINAGPQQLRYFVHTPVGLLLYSVDASTGARRFYHFDEAGNTIFLTETSSTVQTEYAYTPFGDVTGLGLTAGNPFTFGAAGGAIQLGSSGLFRLGTEVYDVTKGRCISRLRQQGRHDFNSDGVRDCDVICGSIGAQPVPIRDHRMDPYKTFAMHSLTPTPLQQGRVVTDMSGIPERPGNDAIVSFGAYVDDIKDRGTSSVFAKGDRIDPHKNFVVSPLDRAWLGLIEGFQSQGFQSQGFHVVVTRPPPNGSPLDLQQARHVSDLVPVPAGSAPGPVVNVAGSHSSTAVLYDFVSGTVENGSFERGIAAWKAAAWPLYSTRNNAGKIVTRCDTKLGTTVPPPPSDDEEGSSP